MSGKLVESGSLLQSTYDIELKLGSGGSSEVYLAWYKRLGKYVIIKKTICHPSIPAQLYRNEVEALKNIKCVYLPQVIDFLVENGCSYIVLEYIEGESLDKFLKKRNRLSLSQLSKCFLQLASTLAVLHRHDVCHRDIKPANIILTPDENVRLIDFNSALVKGHDAGVISLSRIYASPEQYAFFQYCKAEKRKKAAIFAGADVSHFASRKSKAGVVAESNSLNRSKFHNIDWKLSDIYSLGATIYHLFSEQAPLVAARKNVVFPMREAESEGVCSAVERCMKVNPSERFQSADELVDRLQSLNDFI